MAKTYTFARGIVIAFVIVILLLVLTTFSPFFIVGTGEVGVISRLGKVQEVNYGEGLHFKLPVVDNVTFYDVKTVGAQYEVDAASKDLQQVTAYVTVNQYVDGSQAWRLHQQVGSNFQNKVIMPITHETTRAVFSQFTAEELIQKRQAVSASMTDALREKLDGYYVEVRNVNLTNIDFSPEFDQAVEAKVTAEQQARKAEQDLKRVEFEAQQKIEQARAEAEAIRIQNDALQQNSSVIDLRWIEKWDGHLPMYLGGEEGGGVLLNLGG